MNKKYLNIREVSKLLDLEEHVIRYWDSVNTKTNKLRVEGISTKSKGGTRYFNKDNIDRLRKLKNLMYDNGNKNYSLNIANKVLSSKKNSQNINIKSSFTNIRQSSEKSQKLNQILKNMRILIK